MKIDFTNQVVVVTGASRGIGKEIARRFADSGARVVVHFHKNSQAAEQTLANLSGNSHMMISADLADSAAVGNMTEKAVKELGKIDVLVNNAGVYEFHPMATTPFEEWQRSWQKTLFNVARGKQKKADTDDKIPCILEPELTDIGAEKPIFLLKTLLVNLLECFKTIFDTTVVSGILGLALSINIQRGMGGTRMNHLTGKPPA